MARLEYNFDDNRYETDIDEGRLFVNADRFMEIKRDMVLAELEENYPEKDSDDLRDMIGNAKEGDEIDKIDTEAYEELIDSDFWLAHVDERVAKIVPIPLHTTYGQEEE